MAGPHDRRNAPTPLKTQVQIIDMRDPLVAYALVRAVFALLRTPLFGKHPGVHRSVNAARMSARATRRLHDLLVGPQAHGKRPYGRGSVTGLLCLGDVGAAVLLPARLVLIAAYRTVLAVADQLQLIPG
jgi:predicted TIM-barrel enzyme